jgi:quercetin dioxygenase-like cupin family protein
MQMLLEPGETFEHAHQGESVTTLIEGSVDLIASGSRTSLVVGVPTSLAANVSHVLVNVGHEVALLRCTHSFTEVPHE